MQGSTLQCCAPKASSRGRAAVPSSRGADYHTRDILGCQLDSRLLMVVLARQRPLLARHLHEHNVAPEVMFLPWFMCLFVNVLPFGTLLRVWDVLLLEGMQSAHLRAQARRRGARPRTRARSSRVARTLARNTKPRVHTKAGSQAVSAFRAVANRALPSPTSGRRAG